MSRLVERHVSFLFSGSRRPASCTLIAGDSNAVRICSRLDAYDGIDGLPVSGARFINDRKGFHRMLLTRLKAVTYDRVYLHLGSNDVLSAEEKFYKTVTTTCDQIHEASPSTEIVLCEILPRGPDTRTNIIKPRRNEDLQAQRRWIRTANNLLWEFERRIPYVRFLTYHGFCQAHLAKDGLHVNGDGAELCCSTISRDLDYDAAELTKPVPVTEMEDEWPALPSKEKSPLPAAKESPPTIEGEEEPERITESKSFVDVLEECIAVRGPSTACEPIRREVVKVENKKESTKKKPCRLRRPKPLKRRKARTYPKRQHFRELPRPVDSVEVETMLDVTVLVKACKIQGLLQKRRLEEPVHRVSEDRSSDSVNFTPKKKRAPVQWLFCPEVDCKVKCSREDFLLEHIILRHTSQVKTEDPSIQVAEQATSAKEELQEEVPDQGDQSSRPKRETSYCEGLYYVFPPSHWRYLFSMMTVGLLCGGDQNIVARLLLLLAGDVETNPGPTYECPWNDCGRKFDCVRDLRFHIVEHIHEHQGCKWRNCCGCEEEDFNKQWHHIMDHFYKSEEYTPTIEVWYSLLPYGKYDDTINLQACPRHLRSKLQLLLFDEDFHIEEDIYTEKMHREYIKKLKTKKTNSEFKQIVEHFLNKRKHLGENWRNFVSSVNNEAPLAGTITSALTPDSEQQQYDYVETTRPELGSQFYSGTLLKAQPRKRTHSNSNIRSSTYSPWFNNLIGNLDACETAIIMQKDILKTIFEKSMVTAKKQAFIKLEQEAARLASTNKCSNGTFVCTVFTCSINDQEVLYVRYVESGVYEGLMLQNLLSSLKEKYNVSDDCIFLHNVLTKEDIIENNNIYNEKTENVKRIRPDKRFSQSIQIVKSEVSNLKEIDDCPEIKMESFIVHFLPYGSKASIDSPEKMYLETLNSVASDMNGYLFNFRLNKLESNATSSKDLLKEPSDVPKNLLQQSMTLNCLSGDIKRKPNLFRRLARFDSNHFEISHYTGTSLRYKTLMLYIEKQFENLCSFFKSYFPELDGNVESNSNTIDHIKVPCPKRRKITSVKTLSVTKQDLQNQIPSSVEPITESVVNLYDNYCCSLLKQGKLSIQHFNNEDGLLVCCMNDYSELDGSFKRNDFVYTICREHETGNHFYCSCSIYRTLINLKESNTAGEEFVELDLEGATCVSCMHCKFTHEKVVPALDAGNTSESRMNLFIRNAMKDIGKPIVDLSVKNDSHKFSVYVHSDKKPSFVHLTFNKRLNNYLVSCLNGKCISLRGHRRTVRNMLTSSLCQHLTIFKDHPEHWQDFVDSESSSSVIKNDNIIGESTDTFDNSESNTIQFDSECNFDEESGLWKFKCRSSHSPNRRDSPQFQQNLLEHDTWNDANMRRMSDGCLEGPVLVSDIPNETCDCGAGWVSEEGTSVTIHENSRILTVYTLLGPVKCKVHTRACNNSINPCKLTWDEGCKNSLHVLSRDTAAGDEIGWEYVSMVINSGCTFSAYCKLKTETYQVRHNQAKFMVPSVFVKWWFSWAANMKIDFRRPCDVCGFEPKRLCCDGTKVGVGFRHATFEEISSTNSDQSVQATLHRRMDRCFLKNLTGIDKQEMISHRETLNYLARKEIGDLSDKEMLNPDVLDDRINSVKRMLPEEVRSSFERFFTMSSNEKKAYAYVLKMLSTTASVTSLLPPAYCTKLQQLVSNPDIDGCQFNQILSDLRFYAPEVHDLIFESIINNDNDTIPEDIRLLLQFLINESLDLESNEVEHANPQPGTYNPAKFGRAYYFNEFGQKLRNVRPFSIDLDKKANNNDHDDIALDFERCQKLYSKIQCAAPGTSTLFLWFCADHGHCYGFHMTSVEGRKDPAASLYSHLEKPPTDIFYDFACNLQEYCLNRESGYYKNVRFFHDIFHSYAHKCSCAFKSNRLQGFESVNSEICEQFNSFIQCIKKSARQMNQSHFCFYLQFFLHEWNERKRLLTQRKTRIAFAGLQ